MIPQETVNQILDTARIEEVVSDFVTLKRRGANFVACCPFHNEKTPSFYVSPAKGIFKCFGCGKAGTAVGFVMEHEHSSYTEALKYLARKYNIEVQEKEESAEEIAARQRGESIMLATEFAHKFFISQLKTGEGRSLGYSYYRSRGLEDSTIEKYGLGWAPSGRTSLLDAARAAGYKDEYLLAAGLCIQTDDGKLLDKFHERVMFPIHSVSGRVIAFSGRTLRSDKEVAKYVNSPETEIYVKSRSLMGIYFAKGEIARQNRCILVEGNLDVIAMHQLGITNVVASCGTSLTVEQIRLIHKFTDNITIMYDGDSAGIHAALRGIGMVLKEGMNVEVVLLPDGDDPDSFSRKHNLAEVQDFIARNSRDFISFKTDLLLDEAAGDPLKKANLINDIADTIADIPDAVKRSTYVESCAARFGIGSELLFNRITATRRKPAAPVREQKEEQQAPEQPSVQEENPMLAPSERALVSLLLKNGRSGLEFESDSDFAMEDGQTCTVADFIRSSLEADDVEMANTVYRKTYEAYFAEYDAGLSQEDIVRKLLDSPDRTVSGMAAELSMQKYQLTVKSFENSLTTESSWIVTFVPREILHYTQCRVHFRIDEVRRALSTASEEESIPLLKRFMALQNVEKMVKEKMKKI